MAFANSKRVRSFLGLAIPITCAALSAVTSRAQWVESPSERPCDLPILERFESPVGDPADFSQSANGEKEGFRLVRGIKSKGRPHRGVDLSNRAGGGIVRAPADGYVLEAGRFAGWGNLVVMAHRLPGGEYAASLLAHLKKGSLRVRAGDCVRAGQEVGRVGSTGRSTGPHVHFEMRRLGWGDPRLLSWRDGMVLDPIAVLATDWSQGLTPDRGQDERWGWSYVRRVAGLGGAVFGLGEPGALLSRHEFYTWAARAAGDSAFTGSATSRVGSRLALLGLGEVVGGLSGVANTIDASEAVEALAELARHGWLKPLHQAAGVDPTEFKKRGLEEVASALRGAPATASLGTRPLTRAEGALLILAARSQSSPPTAKR